jgi:putative phosphoesterase
VLSRKAQQASRSSPTGAEARRQTKPTAGRCVGATLANVRRCRELRKLLAIVSDIHGNLTAFDAVIGDLTQRGVDRVVHGGDLALAGCQGAEVIDRVRELGWPGIVGNTDELLWRPEEHETHARNAPKLRPLLGMLFDKYAPATRAALGEERIAWLRKLPPEYHSEGVAVVHASPDDLWRAPPPGCEDAELATTYGTLDAEIVVYGHIHRPYVRELDRFTVANSGSVGNPFDGDRRAAYALIVNGAVQIVRVDYDVEREARLLLRSDYPDAPRIAAMRRSGIFVPVPP